MSQNNQPTSVVERSEEDGGLLGRYFRQPGTSDNNDVQPLSNPTNQQLLYECRFCEQTFSKLFYLLKHEKTHTYHNFYCWFCGLNFQMSQPNMETHFKQHENPILQNSGYIKSLEHTVVDKYEKDFEENDWSVNPFIDQDLNDIVDIVRVCLPSKIIITLRISMKIWFLPKVAMSDRIPKYVWMTLPAIKLSWNEVGLKNKIAQAGENFMTAFFDQDSVNDNGSGFVYYAVSSITLKCTKNLFFGCYDEENEFSNEIKMLSKNNIIFNPPGYSSCFQTCLWKYFTDKNLPVSENMLQLNKPLISFHDIENLDLEFLDCGLRIFILTRSHLRKHSIHQVFVSNNFFGKKHRMSLLAICHAKSKHAHFMLIRNLHLLYKKIIHCDMNVRHVCNFCLNFYSRHERVVKRHENFCFDNPNNLRKVENRDGKENIYIKFPPKNSHLETAKTGRSPPNFYIFIDFETVHPGENFGDKIRVCTQHRMKGDTDCNCSSTVASNTIKSLSYSLILVDFSSGKVLFEIFYIQKKEQDESAGEHLANILNQLGYAILLKNQENFPIKMTEEARQWHEQATHCSICKRKFTTKPKDKDILKNINSYDLKGVKVLNEHCSKVRHHLHHVDGFNYVSSLCSKCNLSIQSRYQKVPVLCHNFSRFDHVFLLKHLCKIWGGSMKFIAKSKNDIMAIYAKPFVFKDSLRFLSGSLDKNIELVKKACQTSCEACSFENQCQSCQDRSYENHLSTFSSLKSSKVSEVSGVWNKSRFIANLKKSAFPYASLTSYDEMKMMTTFPDHSNFFSILKGTNVDKNDYFQAKEYFDKYCRNMVDFLEAYNLLDVHLLFCVWKVMSSILQKEFDFYPEEFISLPSYSFAVAKTFIADQNNPSKTCIELFNSENKDLYFQCLDNIRGGVVMLNNKFELDSRFKSHLFQHYSKSHELDSNKFIMNNNKDKEKDNCIMNTNKDKNKEKEKDIEELLYIDATNLYGWSLSQKLPYSDYKYVSDNFVQQINNVLDISCVESKLAGLESLLPDNGAMGFIFDIEVHHMPKELTQFPPFFQKKAMLARNLSQLDRDWFKHQTGNEYVGNRHKQLVPQIDTIYTQFAHFKMVKSAVKMGVLLKIHGGISFNQKFLFSDFISLLAKLRANTTNSAHAQAFKLTSNAVYGKLLQSITKYAKCFNFYFGGIEEQECKMKSFIQERNNVKKKQYIFKDLTILEDDFYMVETQEVEVLADNCPLIAFTILELAKYRNFDFFWQMKRFSPSLKLLYTDTDSFLFMCERRWYKDMAAMKSEFDFSKGSIHFKVLMNITESDISLCRGKLGNYKSEIDCDSLCIAFIGLQKKSYCLLQLRKHRCSKCFNFTSQCTCSNNYGGLQLYHMDSSPTAKGKKIQLLDFCTYLKALTDPKRMTESSFRFEQKKKSLVLSCKKYQSLSNFDRSNFTKSCGLHNIPFSKYNFLEQTCLDQSCVRNKLALQILKDNIDSVLKHLYFFEHDQIKVWK